MGLTDNEFESLTPLEPLIDKCVHCGFCLPSCPSYVVVGQEMDSPRGRIYMMKAGAEGRLPMSDGMVAHFDTCLGCMACETACPSGVRYAPLIEETRAAIEHHHTRPLGERVFRRVLFALLPYPARLRLLAWPLAFVNVLRGRKSLLSLLPAKVRNLIELAPDAGGSRSAAIPEHTPPAGEPRRRVGFVTGCVQQVFFGHVNEATVRVLAAEGCEVVAPRSQGCCGALALHSGRDDDARAFARRLIETFENTDVDAIVINAAGCGSSMKSYADLFRNDPDWSARARAFAAKVRDVTELLAELGTSRAHRHTLNMRVAYHDACHLGHAQGIRQQPRDLLAAIPGVTLVPVADGDLCCGSAGIFNLVQPEMASELGRRKAANIAAASPDIIATTNPGCMLQITAAARAAGTSRPIVHVVELLDASIRGGQLTRP
ncbi:MAG TPA: glycolate oxidase subunit GlcF [Vicinamibacterales bacterium]|nr:glycolate oxidase subunit GlcF [Vicinamibacterales bacterium]